MSDIRYERVYNYLLYCFSFILTYKELENFLFKWYKWKLTNTDVYIIVLWLKAVYQNRILYNIAYITIWYKSIEVLFLSNLRIFQEVVNDLQLYGTVWNHVINFTKTQNFPQSFANIGFRLKNDTTKKQSS